MTCPSVIRFPRSAFVIVLSHATTEDVFPAGVPELSHMETFVVPARDEQPLIFNY